MVTVLLAQGGDFIAEAEAAATSEKKARQKVHANSYGLNMRYGSYCVAVGGGVVTSFCGRYATAGWATLCYQ